MEKDEVRLNARIRVLARGRAARFTTGKDGEVEDVSDDF